MGSGREITIIKRRMNCARAEYNPLQQLRQVIISSMAAWRGIWEWYLGLPVSQEGLGTQWTWVTRPPWPEGWPTWLACLVGALLVASLISSYRREAATLPRSKRWVLCSLRLAALIVALTLWSQPTLLVARTGLAPVAVLLDTSASMSLPDLESAILKETPSHPITSPKERKADLPIPWVSGERRWDRVVSALTVDDGHVLRKLLERHPLRIYQFDEHVVPIGPPQLTTTAHLQEALTALARLEPIGERTRPAEAVRQVLAELRGLPPTALVILTDGVASESEADRLSTVADLLRRRGVRLIVIPVGSEQAVPDLQLYDVVMDDVAFVGDPVIVSGKIKTTGIPPTQVRVEIRHTESAQPVAVQQVSIRGDGGTVRFEQTVMPTAAGEWDLTIEVVPLPGEMQRENNRERRRLSIREEKQRVLLVESAPRYEFRYLKQWCEREKTIELKTLLVEADPEYAQEDRTAIAYFPVQREELAKFDVVVLGDVAPTQLGVTAASWLAELVREKGLGLVLIAGIRHNPRSFVGTELEALLPFSGNALSAESRGGQTPYQPQLTLDGQKGVPMFRLPEQEAGSRQPWSNLPGFYGLLPIRRLKPGARVLAEHPLLQGETDRLPVIVLQQVGAGKVLFHATDETWRWRFRTGDEYFGRYWGQALRYLSRGHLLGSDRAAELVVDRQIYRRGETVVLRARYLDERLAPAKDEAVQVMVEQAGQGRREVQLTRLPYLPTVFEGQLRQLADGSYRAWISRPSFATTPPAVDFRVESPQRELQKQAADRTDLRLAAERAGGHFLELQQLTQLPSLIPTGEAVPLEQGVAVSLWNRHEPLLLLAGLLTLEWVLRRRWRLV